MATQSFVGSKTLKSTSCCFMGTWHLSFVASWSSRCVAECLHCRPWSSGQQTPGLARSDASWAPHGWVDVRGEPCLVKSASRPCLTFHCFFLTLWMIGLEMMLQRTSRHNIIQNVLSCKILQSEWLTSLKPEEKAFSFHFNFLYIFHLVSLEYMLFFHEWEDSLIVPFHLSDHLYV